MQIPQLNFYATRNARTHLLCLFFVFFFLIISLLVLFLSFFGGFFFVPFLCNAATKGVFFAFMRCNTPRERKQQKTGKGKREHSKRCVHKRLRFFFLVVNSGIVFPFSFLHLRLYAKTQ